ncbi:MAG: type II/IV secretion system protein [Patescibacteria group bacterium]
MTQKDKSDELFNKIRRGEEEDLTKMLADKLGLAYFNLEYTKPDPEALKIIPEVKARELKIAGIQKIANNVIIGALNPQKKETEEYIRTLDSEGYIIEVVALSQSSLEKAWEEYRFIKEKKVQYADVLEISPEKLTIISEKINLIKDIEPLIKNISAENPFEILEYLMAGAIKFESSDIHFEPTESVIGIKYRIDGMLYSVCAFSKNVYGLLKNRIKLAAGLMVNVSNKPQDGRFTISLDEDQIEIRVSAIPSSFDETIVMRLLNSKNIIVGLDKLGLREDHFRLLEEIIQLPNGLILNTGPTGSGKTTTLYAILNKIKREEIKIITIEDPIEYRLAGITQTQVDLRRKYTFADGLRSILRQDPDVILVGEIRDKETAGIAINASLTGHLVVSTLHTNDSLGAIPRLVDLGVDKFLLPPSLRLIIAQRLIRKVCKKCAKPLEISDETKKAIIDELKDVPDSVKGKTDIKKIEILGPVGCEACKSTGYKGRIGIFEMLHITSATEKIIYDEPTVSTLLESAKKEGFTTIRQDALLKLLEGITTIEEVVRETGPLA